MGYSPNRARLRGCLNHWWFVRRAGRRTSSRCARQEENEGECRISVRDALAGDMAWGITRACRIVDLWIHNAVKDILGGIANGNG